MTGRANLFFAPLRSLRLCVGLYWRSVSTGHDREIATTGGCPSPMLRMVPTPEIGFACNVGFVLRFCALRPQLLRDRLFECVEPQPGFCTRQTNFAKSR